jgi:hypothetical protein
MASRIHGISVVLFGQTQTGVDAFNRPIYSETAETVENVVVGEPSTQELVDTLNLTGKRAAYTLGIPKGDEHEWKDKIVMFFGERFRVIGKPIKGIEDMVPLSWNQKCMVEHIE